MSSSAFEGRTRVPGYLLSSGLFLRFTASCAGDRHYDVFERMARSPVVARNAHRKYARALERASKEMES